MVKCYSIMVGQFWKLTFVRIRVNLVYRARKALEDLKEMLANRVLLAFREDLVLTDLKDHQEVQQSLRLLEQREWLVRMESRADLDDLVFQVTVDYVADQACPAYKVSKEKLATEVCLASTPSSDHKDRAVKEALLAYLVFLVQLVKMDCLVLLALKVHRVTKVNGAYLVIQVFLDQREMLDSQV